ncbi:MAG: response regulator [Burkholderiales bacterium]|nr:response regulator [Burkholderiales bacterium]
MTPINTAAAATAHDEALARERNLLRSVIDNLPELVFVKDLDHRLVLANAAWIRVRARGDASLVGRPVTGIDPPELPARILAEDREVFESGRASGEREIEIEDGPGDRRCFLVRKSPLRNAAGGIIGLVGICRDITEHKQHVEDLARFTAGLEARVRERTAQLERANRELEAFTFSVSHDLRAPLRAIDGFTERVLAEGAGALGAKAEGYIQRVRHASQRMTRLIDNLLELSHTGRRELRRRKVDLSALANEIGAELREFEPERTVALKVQQGITAVADGELLRIVLDNLLRNAWKFTSARARGEVEFGCERREGGAVYFVRDNGAGFDMRRAGRLFTPFQRLHRSVEFPGTGIGLAVAQRVVRRHQGAIWAQSEVDRGATFFFTLDAGAMPAAADAAAGAAGAAHPAPPRPARDAAPMAAREQPAVLIVDDDETVLDTLREELGRDGHLVFTAPDGAAALELLKRGDVAVVVSDYSMPGMSGTEFLGAVRERHPGVVRILFTGRPDVRVLSEAVNEGGIDYLVDKDWDHLYLRTRVRESVVSATRSR